MPSSHYDVVVVGGGAAGIGAGRRLHDAGLSCLIVEARPRLGGRAWTITGASGYALDLGCGWLHSANRNPWVTIATAQGRTIDRSPPPWSKPSLPYGFPPEEQKDFHAASDAYFAEVENSVHGPDRPASTLLPANGRWNALITSIGTYISGAELDKLSLHDLANYTDSHKNWRVVEGYGTTIAAHAEGVPVVLDCPATTVDHSGAPVVIETTKGSLTATQVILTLPTNVLAAEAIRFTPPLPEKIEAAHGLPLGLADKLFLALDKANEFDADSSFFGRTDRVGTGAYQFRPLGRPMIEAYFGGTLAAELEAGGEKAFFDFAESELVGRLGSDFGKRIKPIHIHTWRSDPLARGSYSFALPGKASCRQVLAAPVDGRLFFAGEACSTHDFSTAHGALLTGLAAAKQVIAVRAPRG